MCLGWDTIIKEIDKCIILCANCHIRVTSIQRNYFKTASPHVSSTG